MYCSLYFSNSLSIAAAIVCERQTYVVLMFVFWLIMCSWSRCCMLVTSSVCLLAKQDSVMSTTCHTTERDPWILKCFLISISNLLSSSVLQLLMYLGTNLQASSLTIFTRESLFLTISPQCSDIRKCKKFCIFPPSIAAGDDAVYGYVQCVSLSQTS